MQTEIQLQNEVIALAAVYGSIIGGLLGNSLINLTSQDINTYEKVNALLNQINAQPRSDERDALAAALNNLLAFYSGDDGA